MLARRAEIMATFPGINPLLALAIVLVAGVAGGALARRTGLPAVTGQILAGILLGPSGLHALDDTTLHGMQPITHFALGLIAVAVGSHLNLQRLRNATRRLSFLLLLETTLTPCIVFVCVLILPDTSWTFGLLLASLAISTAPATIVAIIKEARAKGVFVKTLVGAVALNNMACICVFEVAHVIARINLAPPGTHGMLDAFVAPFRQLLASAALGACAAVALTVATRRVVQPERLATASIIAILLTAGVAEFLHVSTLLSCMFLGVLLANLTPDKEEIGHTVFTNFETAMYAVFFTLAGSELNLKYALPAGVLSMLLVGARLIGKVASARIAMRLAGATDNVRRYLGLALVPQAGVAVGLILLVREDPILTPLHDLFLAVGLTSVLLNEIIGPILARTAIARSGDMGKDRDHLIDFLHEENIHTDLAAATKEDAIRSLVDLLVRTNHLDVDREDVLRSVMEREQEASTCVGGGLALPHCQLESGRSIVGVMGLSRQGLALETPDGRPVHCIVLLATPASLRNRHLAVQAAFARTIGRDRNIQLQLFNAKTPAHAYEILHAEDIEDFDVLLE